MDLFKDAAIFVESKEELMSSLQKLCDHPDLIETYAQKAFVCCKKNHQKKIVQENLLKDFEMICNK